MAGGGDASDAAATARTLLFVPGDRPERFGKAAASGADVIVIDLEDAVTPPNRSVARTHVRAWLDAGHAALVRINAVGTPDFAADLDALAGFASSVMLAKAASAADIDAAVAGLGPGVRVVPLIETAGGVLSAPAIAAHPNVVRIAFGSIDFAAAIGVDPANRDALLSARSALVIASAAAGIAPPIDGVTIDLTAGDAAIDDTRYGRSLGFTGKLCVHPAQIAPTRSAFAPSDVERDWAARIVSAAGAGGVTSAGGQMIDPPVLARARQILEAGQDI